MLVAVLTAMAWTEAYGGYSSAVIWIFVIHSAEREIRECHHYSVDVVVAIYVGIMLWKMTCLFWPMKDQSKDTRLSRLEKIQGRLMRAAKDDNIEEIRLLLKEVEVSNQVRENSSSKAMWLFSGGSIIFTLSMVLLAFTLTSDR
ncbi:hypothetical protein RND71_028037 [Anisodus tanguticus]|uniref:Sphingomyelin synthase-like domain-containing protein n=1 Tax=Anisodus tanguticus TaxID=243964 RepID=A0AAE1RK05_9SOLA|nr:hypothetical protein RND71_028037 [Anisodus tanguticus]